MFSSHVKELKNLLDSHWHIAARRIRSNQLIFFTDINLRAASDIAAKQLCGPGESRTPDLLVANEAL